MTQVISLSEALESYFILDYPVELYATYEELVEQASVLESFSEDLLDDLYYDSVMEATGDNSDTGAADIGAKFKSGFKKIESGKKKKDQKLISEGQREVNEASKELKEAEKNADTPEKKKKLSTAAKIAIGVGGAVLLGLLAYVGIKNRGKIVSALSKLKKNKGTSVGEVVSDVSNATTAAVSTPVESAPVKNEEMHEAIKNGTAITIQRNPVKSINQSSSQTSSSAGVRLPDNNGSGDKKSENVKTPILTERQQKAQYINTERARKKQLKDWAISHGRGTDSKEMKKIYRKISQDRWNDKLIDNGNERYASSSTGFGYGDKYDKIINNMKYYDEGSEEFKKRRELIFKSLKRDSEKITNIPLSEINNMSDIELMRLSDKIRKLDSLQDEFAPNYHNPNLTPIRRAISRRIYTEF